MRFRRKVALTLVSVAILGGVTVSAAETAQANVGFNWCIGNTSECINAWNGGPWVKLYTGGTTANGDFLGVTGFSNFEYMDFTNSGSAWYHHCIGDAYNDANDART